jgi:hypothetical protein
MNDTMICFHLKEAKALSRILLHQYIDYEDLEAQEAVNKLFKLVSERENELARDHSKPA